MENLQLEISIGNSKALQSIAEVQNALNNASGATNINVPNTSIQELVTALKSVNTITEESISKIGAFIKANALSEAEIQQVIETLDRQRYTTALNSEEYLKLTAASLTLRNAQSNLATETNTLINVSETSSNAVEELSSKILQLTVTEDSSKKAIYDFIVANQLTEQQINQVNSVLIQKKQNLALSSAEYKKSTLALANMNEATKLMSTISSNNVASSSAMTMALNQFGFALGDASMFAVNFRMGLMGIGNNIPMVAQLLAQARNEAAVTGKTFKEQLVGSLTGGGGLVLAINAAMMAIQMFSMQEVKKETKDAGEEARNAARQFMDLYEMVSLFRFENIRKGKENIEDAEAQIKNDKTLISLKQQQKTLGEDLKKLETRQVGMDKEGNAIEIPNTKSPEYQNALKNYNEITEMVQDRRNELRNSINASKTILQDVSKDVEFISKKVLVKTDISELKSRYTEPQIRVIINELEARKQQYVEASKEFETIQKNIDLLSSRNTKSKKKDKELSEFEKLFGVKEDEFVQDAAKDEVSFNNALTKLESKYGNIKQVIAVVDKIENEVINNNPNKTEAEITNNRTLLNSIKGFRVENLQGIYEKIDFDIQEQEAILSQQTSLTSLYTESYKLLELRDKRKKIEDDITNSYVFSTLSTIEQLKFTQTELEAKLKVEKNEEAYKEITRKIAGIKKQIIDYEKGIELAVKGYSEVDFNNNLKVIENNRNSSLLSVKSKIEELKVEADYLASLKSEYEKEKQLLLSDPNAEQSKILELEGKIIAVNTKIKDNTKETTESIANAWKTSAIESAENIDKVYGQMASNAAKFAGMIYKTIQDNSKKELTAEKDKRLKILKNEEDERLNKAFTEEEKNRIKKEYADKEAALDSEIDQRQREAGKAWFNFQKDMNYAEALTNTAVAVTSALKTEPPWAGIALASIIGGLGAAEVVTIAATEPPGFEGGGLVKGDKQYITINEAGQEFVMNASATQRYLPYLEAMNSNREINFMSSSSIPSMTGLIVEFKSLRRDFQQFASRNIQVLRSDRSINIDKNTSKAITITGSYEMNRESL